MNYRSVHTITIQIGTQNTASLYKVCAYSIIYIRYLSLSPLAENISHSSRSYAASSPKDQAPPVVPHPLCQQLPHLQTISSVPPPARPHLAMQNGTRVLISRAVFGYPPEHVSFNLGRECDVLQQRARHPQPQGPRPVQPKPSFASRPLRRALLTPQANPGSRYRCDKSD